MFIGGNHSIIGVLTMAGFLSASEVQAVSLSPYKLIEETPFLGLPITNSMVMSWVISLFIILAVRMLVGKPQLVPSAGQAVVENLLGGIRDIMEPIVGKALIGKVFPVLIGFFTFILIQNWSGLLPGVGAFGFYDEHGHLIYWMRPGNADLNMTVALAILSATVGWTYFVLRYAGLKTLLLDLFGNKADPREVPKAIYILLFPVFFGVGLIEVISILFRNVSLSFRLFGNVFGGENLLASMTELAGWIVPIPFYFLELLIGGVQALVFTLLTAVYIGLICNHGDDEGHAH
jgi:F-type H+-transporting ATPase subunit a